MRATAGKHAIPATRMRHGRRPIIAVAIGLSAAVAAVTLALTGVPGHVAAASPRKTAAAAAAVRAPTLTPAETAAWHKVVSTTTGREKVFKVFEDSYGRVAGVGAGPLVTPGTNQLVLSWGLSGAGGEHFWIIASYADILRGALHQAEPYCEALAVCVGIEWAMDRLASGWAPVSNHGVWAEIHFWPYWTGVYRW
jgi:hypothetical protein